MCIDEELQELFNKQYQEYKFFKDNGDAYNHQKDFFKSLICYKACIDHYPNEKLFFWKNPEKVFVTR